MAAQSRKALTGLTIRRAEPSNAIAIRMLLSGLRDGTHTFVACANEHQQIVGAAAMTHSCRQEPLTGPGIAVEVIEPCRRQGIATQLLTQLEIAAQHTYGANGLYAAHRVEWESPEYQAWQWLSFEPIETVDEHVLPIDQFESRLGPILERMRANGHLPTGAEIIPLYRSNLAAVMQLHLDEMGGSRQELYQKLRGNVPGAFHPRYSRVLLVDGRVQGCVLAHRVAKYTAKVDANIVAPELRGGWANVWLKLEAARRALTLGIREFTYTSFDRYTDTRSFSKKLGGRIARRTALMARKIDTPSPSRCGQG